MQYIWVMTSHIEESWEVSSEYLKTNVKMAVIVWPCQDWLQLYSRVAVASIPYFFGFCCENLLLFLFHLVEGALINSWQWELIDIK